MNTRTTALSLLSTLCLGALAGCGDATPAAANPPFRAPVAITRGGTFRQPQDATPDPDGNVVYFTALGGAQGAGVFRVPAAGGDATQVASGAPFAAPTSLAISSDGRRLYVADTRAGNGGALLTIPTSGGDASLVAGTEGTAAAGVEVVAQDGGDAVYFTGVREGQAAVFRIGSAGGAPTVVARGAPMMHLSGVTATRAGVVFVSDRVDASTGLGAVYRIEGGQVTALVNNVRLGNPAGLALTPDERVLAVSSQSARSGTSQVLLVDLATQRTSVFNDVIGANREAGGVHRAHGGRSNDFAWCGVTAGTGGQGVVFRITLY